jgi:peptide-methionine (R)-S-oxide reductase
MTTKQSASGFNLNPLRGAQRDAAAAHLSDEQKRILLQHGTEHPFCGTLLDNKREGTYACALCGLPLFSSQHKFNSGTGWPSFYAPVDAEHISNIRDTSHGMIRVEIRCARCDGHLGHVFEDGPAPTHLRYCLNSEAMQFFDAGEAIPQRVA